MSKRRWTLSLAALALAACAGGAQAAAPSKCTVGVMAELPVTMRGQRPLVTAKLNGREASFVADSGAFYSTITSSLASELKLPEDRGSIILRGAGGSVRAYAATVKAFDLAGSHIPNIQFIVIPSIGGDVDGLLGQNILGVADVEYDLANGVIRLMRPKDCADTALAYWAAGKPISIIEIEPPSPSKPHTVGTVMVNGAKVRAMFDTGAGVSMLSLRAAARAGVRTDSPGVTTVAPSVGLGSRPVRSWIAPFSSFEIGGEKITTTRLRLGDASFADQDMVIGADFFLSHRVYVSNKQKRLYFTYNGGRVFDLTSPASAPAGTEPPEPPEPQSTASADDPKDADGFARRGAALESRRDYAGAIADFTRAMELDPKEPDYPFRRATARLANRQPVLAISDLDAALRLQPGHPDALTARAGLHLAAGDRRGAKADLDAIASAAARDADLRLRLAGLYSRADFLEEAVAQYGLWLSTHPDNGARPVALNGRCWGRALLGRDLDDALADCNRALAISPGSASYLDSRGMVQLRLGAYDKAIADYDAVIRVRPKSAWSLYGRGLAKLGKGLKAEGQADLAAATAIQPGLPAEAKAHGLAPPAP
jgi:tetratricopeptide (TPR) repeat protein/predicted aspartyl protease